MVDAIGNSAAATAAAGSSDTSSALGKLDGDFQSFLKLLTVQLQNQDPTDPLDTNQLTDQITQFSQVEQQINTNKTLQKLLSASQSSAVNNAVSYVDRFVEYTGNSFYQRQGGAPILSYTLPKEAASVTVSITTESGTVLYSKDVTADGQTVANKSYPIAWDGKDMNGNPVATGKYKVNVVAKDADGKDITPTVKITDMVTEVTMQDGEVTLVMGDLKVPASSVTSIKGLYAKVDVPDTGTDTSTDTGSTDETDTDTTTDTSTNTDTTPETETAS